MIEWLLLPIDPTSPHQVGTAIAWHGRLMVLAWAMLFPAGILAARFFKVTPRQRWPDRLDNRAWWDAHRWSQYLGGAAAFVGLLIIIFRARAGWAPLGFHALFGWAVLALTATQFLGAWLRGSKGGPTDPGPDGSLRGDHYDMTLRRRVFEYVHKFVGYAALLLSIAAIATGLLLANAPRWMWVLVTGWWLFLALSFVVLQKQGRAIDTYQAIWGADPAHPGNRRKPIGFGVRRLDNEPDE